MTSAQFVVAWIRTRGRSDRGAALLEYAFLLVLIVVACLTALTFLGVNAYWERAIQGAIILTAVAVDAWRQRPPTHARALAAGAGA